MDQATTQEAKDGTFTVGLVVLNYDGLEDTCRCLEAVATQTWPPGRMQVVVVDNGSPPGQAAALAARFPRFRHLALPENRGFTGGANQAMALLLAEQRCRYIALLNNDAFPRREWLQALVARAEGEERCGLVASLMLLAHTPERVENAGITLLATGDALPRGRGEDRRLYGQPCRLTGACGGALLLRVEMLRQIGLFQEEFFANFEDLDLSLRAAAAGWSCWYEPAALVEHRLSRTIDRMRDRAFFTRSRRNQAWAQLANLPGYLLLAHLPLYLLRELALLLLLPLTGRPALAVALVASRLHLLQLAPTLWQARRRAGHLRRQGTGPLPPRLSYRLLRHYLGHYKA